MGKLAARRGSYAGRTRLGTCSRISKRAGSAGISAVLVVASLVLMSSLASAAVWSLQTTPNPTGAERSILEEIACEPSSTNTCTAVGTTTRTGVSTPLAEYWNGSTWAIQTTATPGEAVSSELKSNFCTSVTTCWAVGYYRTATAELTLAERWNGREWSVQTTPTPAGATEVRLNGVACFSNCTAVGYSVVGGVKSSMAMEGFGSRWSLQTVPVPAGAISSELESVECNSTVSCIAVGRYYQNASTYKAMSAKWDGRAWSLTTVPNPAGTTKSILIDLNCTEAAKCTAVGAYTDGSGRQRTLALRWDGTSWTVQTTPNPAESENTVLQNVSCKSSNECIAAGDYLRRGTWTTLVETWDGAVWATETPPNRAGATFDILTGVSCRSLTCLASGWATDAEGRSTTQAQIRNIVTPPGTGVEGGLSPADLRSAYKIPGTAGQRCHCRNHCRVSQPKRRNRSQYIPHALWIAGMHKSKRLPPNSERAWRSITASQRRKWRSQKLATGDRCRSRYSLRCLPSL